MRFPMFLAVAWLSPSARRLLSNARQIAIDSGDDCIDGIHLFKSAASMPNSKASRSIPPKARSILNNQTIISNGHTTDFDNKFLPVTLSIKEACRVLSAPGLLILPEHLLQEVLKRDMETRKALLELLGDELFTDVKSHMLLRGFNHRERTELTQIKDQLKEQHNVQSN